MTLWIIEPLDPLIVRDGRPFNATPGARARSLPFPFPSTTTGGVRTRAGQDGNGAFNKANIEAVKQVTVRGPLLAEMEANGEIRFLVPAPADALVFDDEQKTGRLERKWLRPLTLPDGADHDKPANFPPYFAGLPHHNNRKPAQRAPNFWYWERLEDWLFNPEGETALLNPADLGHDGPQPDRRIHVKIDPTNFTGEDSMLFATSGLTFWRQDKNSDDQSPPELSKTKKLLLAVAVDELNALSIGEGLAPLGGERRLMRWHEIKSIKGEDLLKPKKGLDHLADRITQNGGHCRLVLLTPAYFKDGWLPGDFGEKAGTTVTLEAAAVPKPIVVSGWDFASKPPGPKPTRRLAPAGSVYFVKVEGDIEQWINDRWLHPLSDDEELAMAGFGLTAVGLWNGKKPTIQLKEESNG